MASAAALLMRGLVPPRASPTASKAVTTLSDIPNTYNLTSRRYVDYHKPARAWLRHLVQPNVEAGWLVDVFIYSYQPDLVVELGRAYSARKIVAEEQTKELHAAWRARLANVGMWPGDAQGLKQLAAAYGMAKVLQLALSDSRRYDVFLLTRPDVRPTTQIMLDHYTQGIVRGASANTVWVNCWHERPEGAAVDPQTFGKSDFLFAFGASSAMAFRGIFNATSHVAPVAPRWIPAAVRAPPPRGLGLRFDEDSAVCNERDLEFVAQGRSLVAAPPIPRLELRQYCGREWRYTAPVSELAKARVEAGAAAACASAGFGKPTFNPSNSRYQRRGEIVPAWLAARAEDAR